MGGTCGEQADRRACVNCPIGKSKNAAGSGKCTLCAKGKYAHTEGRASCNDCGTGSFNKEEGRAMECELCNIGEYQDSKGKTACKACEEGKFQPNIGERSCIEHICDVGKYVYLKGTATQKAICRNCKTCGGSTFLHGCGGESKPNDGKCSAFKTCPPGTEAENPSKQSHGGQLQFFADRICHPCKPGFYSSEENSRRCSKHTDCWLYGKYFKSAGTPTSDSVCGECEDKSRFGASEYILSGCQAKDPRRPLYQLCGKCGEGQRVTQGCLKYSDTQCADCEPGKYMDEAAHENSQCTPHTPPCPPGSFQETGPSVFNDRQCAACNDKQYQDESGQTSCKPMKTCGNGEFSKAPERSEGYGFTSDIHSCLGCPEGTYVLEPDNPLGFSEADDECQAYKDCWKSGQMYTKTPGTNVSDNMCAVCNDRSALQLRQFISSGCNEDSNSEPLYTNCTACGPGQKVSQRCLKYSDTICTPCQAGYYREQASHFSTECVRHAKCLHDGIYLVKEGTGSENARCAVCEDRSRFAAPQYIASGCEKDDESRPVYKNCTVCEEERQMKERCTLFTDTVCDTSTIAPTIARSRDDGSPGALSELGLVVVFIASAFVVVLIIAFVIVVQKKGKKSGSATLAFHASNIGGLTNETYDSGRGAVEGEIYMDVEGLYQEASGSEEEE